MRDNICSNITADICNIYTMLSEPHKKLSKSYSTLAVFEDGVKPFFETATTRAEFYKQLYFIIDRFFQTTIN